ncbi:MAG: protein-L-isoaspartate O-methyltransferase [Betaproteobacteria bacterium]|nr:protein-L-isoaspartate O-methyltransferase [Betaproteobacteria bacterium]MBA3775758.1 protein-L-isoaspartate O-methyltransferase [Betaproteobacteria bacterium]
MDFELARFNMVEQQIRTWEVLDQDVLDLLFVVKREAFVPPQWQSLAFADLELPLPNGEKMWAPKVEARVLQSLQLHGGEKVLEVGTGSGYFTALLASRAATVTSVEIERALSLEAAQKLARARLANVRCEVGDAARGWGEDTYDAIVLTGSTPLLPEALFTQLRPGGQVFAVVGDLPVMTARLVRWAAPGSRVSTDLFETVVAPLQNAATPARFQF